MSYPGAEGDRADLALRAAGYHYLGTFEDAPRELLRRAGFQGRERWTRWNNEAGCYEPQRWYPLWAVQAVLWFNMGAEAPPVGRWAKVAKARRERLTVEGLRALAHDPEARAAVQAMAHTGMEQAHELLRLSALRGMLRRHPRAVWVGVCTSSVLGDGFNCRCTPCSMDTTPEAAAYSAHPHVEFELRTSELHPDDQELLDGDAPVAVLDLCIGEEP